MSLIVIVFVFLISFCNCTDVYHEGSKITFSPNYPADFFGYSVAVYESSLLVGAPKAKNTGVVFSCPLQNLGTGTIRCMPLKLRYRGKQKEFFRNDMWFGASLAVGPTGKILICAPRWAGPLKDSKPMAFESSNYGACYLQMKRHELFIFPDAHTRTKQIFTTNYTRNDYSDYNSFHASNKTRLQFYTFTHAGLSTKVTDSNIIIGAPGLMQWAGGVIQYTYGPGVNNINYSQKPTYNPFFIDDVGPDEYFGYSVESGIFEDGGKMLYVTGGPKGKHGLGLVLIIEPPTLETAPPNILAKIAGPQLGAYFGASLSCLDVNGDGRTDLLVGAPNYVKWFDRDALYDQGAVYVYLNKEQTKGFTLEYSGHVTGSESNGAKFGYGIVDLGDVDADGYNDVAISAPWENDGIGAVYIYGGGKEGLKSQYVQRIVASAAWGFGMGLTRGHDVDGNKCNDLVVGAPDSGTAYIFRCIPTVKVQANIMIPEILSLPLNTTNFTAEFCINITPLRNPKTIVMELQATATVDPEGNRAAVAGNSTYKVSATPPYHSCESKMIELKPAADLSKPISIMFDVKSIDRMQGILENWMFSQSQYYYFTDNPTHFLANAGRVSSESTMHSEFDIQLARDCGDDLICRPWLEITLEAMSETCKADVLVVKRRSCQLLNPSSPYIPGAGGRLGATVKVLNTEETAFGLRVNVTLPSPPKRVLTPCNLQGLNMTCDLPSPLNRNQTIEWEVEFEYTEDMLEMGFTMISADIVDPVVGRNVSGDASQYLEIDIEPVSNISASGKVAPNATLMVTRKKFAEGGYIPFLHYFQIINAGPSDRSDLHAIILSSETCNKVSLASEIAGCVRDEVNSSLALYCTWSVAAKESLSVGLPLRFILTTKGKTLEATTTCNVTTTLFLSLEDKVNAVSVTTVLILETSLPYWISVIVGIVVGFLLLAIISYIGHKLGFYTRKRPSDYNKLQTDDRAGCSTGSQPNDDDADGSNEEEVLKPGRSDNSQASPESANSVTSSEEDLSKPGCSYIQSSPETTASIHSKEDSSPSVDQTLSPSTNFNKLPSTCQVSGPIKEPCIRFSELTNSATASTTI